VTATLFRPLQLSLATRVVEQGHAFHLVVTAALGIRLDSGQALLEMDYLGDSLKQMGEQPMPDPGLPKPQGEYLVSGRFHAPGGRPVVGHEVRVQLGGLAKSLFLFGPRSWGPLGPEPPGPFTTLALDPAFAFGGPGCPANPGGIGCQDGQLPRIEDPHHLVTSPLARPRPAGFGPLGPMDPRRTRHQPRYGPDTLQRDHPGFPAALDWRYFLCAPEDQRLPGFFRGDEPFGLHHLHPDRPVLTGKLPGLRVRCFLRGAPELPEELPMHLDTVWLFPELALARLYWRGGLRVRDDEAAQVSHLLGAYEDGPPRPLAHYREAYGRRLGGQGRPDALLDSLNTGDLIPAGSPCAMALLQARATRGTPSPMVRNLEARAAALQAQVDAKLAEALEAAEAGLAEAELPAAARVDLRALGGTPVQAAPDPDLAAFQAQAEALLPGLLTGNLQLPQFSFQKLDQILAAMTGTAQADPNEGGPDGLVPGKQAQAEAELARVRDQVQAQLRDPPPELPAEAQAGLAAVLRALDPPPADPPPLPRLDPAVILGALAASTPHLAAGLGHLQGLGAAGAQAGELGQLLAQTLADQQSQAQAGLDRAGQAFKAGYRLAAHALPPGGSPHAEPLAAVRARFLAAVAEGRPVAAGDWACLDLSGQGLDGLDLRGAFLEQVNFRGASLRGADLREAILARADLADADLTGALLAGANVGAVRAGRACFREADLRGARLSQGQFPGACFCGARLEGAEVLDFQGRGADFSGAAMPGLTWLRPALDGARFRGADLARSVFMRGRMADLDFAGCGLQHTVWADLGLLRVSFREADLEAACFVTGDPDLSLEQVQFVGARMDRSHFQGQRMAGCDLSGASLANAQFGSADLRQARLCFARARAAQFARARLTGADLTGIDLREGSLAKADLVQARFAGANLCAVDFLRATLGGTDFRDSNLDRTLLAGWRPA